MADRSFFEISKEQSLVKAQIVSKYFEAWAKVMVATQDKPFRFKNDSGARTSHHLIFVSKDFLGYEIMKDIMARESSSANQDVASFEYSPATVHQPFLFQLSRPLDELEKLLLERFAGRTLTLDQIYQEHNVGTPYVKKNYRDALLSLEAAGKFFADPSRRRKGTFAHTVKATFPHRSRA